MDFSAYPHLIKYLPNWLERLYPRLAQFARGEGYPCGNQGVFIPRRNRCWTHPKTGQRLKKPLTYQMYKDAKEKSQRSRTEKGRTALETREQGFRDKAREKVKGWQKNKTPEPEIALKVGTKQVNIKGSPELYKELNLTHDPSLGWQVTNKNGDVLRQPKDGQLQPTHRFKERSQAENFAKQVIAKVDRMTGKPATKSETKQTPNSSGESGKAIAKSEPKQTPNSTGGKSAGGKRDVANSQSIKSVNLPYKNPLGLDGAPYDIIGKRLSEEVKKLKPKTENITIKTRDGDKVVSALNYGGLAILEETDERTKKSIYGITHIASGRRIPLEADSKDYAENIIAGLLATDVNWNLEDLKGEDIKTANSLANKIIDYNRHVQAEAVKAYNKQQKEDLKTKAPAPGSIDSDHNKWLDVEAKKLKGENKSIEIKTTKGKQSIDSFVHKGLAVHNAMIESDPSKYALTHVGTGKSLGTFDDENQAKKAIIELYGGVPINWEEKDLKIIPDINKKMSKAKKKIAEAIKNDLDFKREKNDFNSHQILTQFGIGSLRRRKSKQTTCCCDSLNPLRRRKTKQTPRLKRRGNRYA